MGIVLELNRFIFEIMGYNGLYIVELIIFLIWMEGIYFLVNIYELIICIYFYFKFII